VDQRKILRAQEGAYTVEQFQATAEGKGWETVRLGNDLGGGGWKITETGLCNEGNSCGTRVRGKPEEIWRGGEEEKISKVGPSRWFWRKVKCDTLGVAKAD